MPTGANLYLGFSDLQADLERLDGSQTWVGFEEGENYESFIRSRLWLRFQDRLTQMESLIGAPLDGPGARRGRRRLGHRGPRLERAGGAAPRVCVGRPRRSLR